MKEYIYPEPMEKAKQKIQSLLLNQSLIGITEQGSEIAKRMSGVAKATDHLKGLKEAEIASEEDTQALESMTRWAKGPRETIGELRKEYGEKIHALLSVDRHRLFLRVMTVGEAQALAESNLE